MTNSDSRFNNIERDEATLGKNRERSGDPKLADEGQPSWQPSGIPPGTAARRTNIEFAAKAYPTIDPSILLPSCSVTALRKGVVTTLN